MMALLFEFVALLVWFVTKPIMVMTLFCEFGVRCISVMVLTWIELLRAAIYLHLAILWRPVIGVISVLSLPVRALTALYRERMLENQLYGMMNELEIVLWEKKELEDRLHIAIEERKMMEVTLKELEEEREEAIAKIELLEEEVHELKDEIQRLKEVQGKSLWDSSVQGDGKYDYNSTKNMDNFLTYAPQNDKKMTQLVLPDGEIDDFAKKQSKVRLSMTQLDTIDILAKQRALALSRSLFSAIMSLAVGIIIWESKDPCTPLVVALFSVVTMSLSSVIKFFRTIKQKPASDVVSLLCLNWFLLGTLTYPMLPSVARASTPLVSSFSSRMLKWLV